MGRHFGSFKGRRIIHFGSLMIGLHFRSLMIGHYDCLSYITRRLKYLFKLLMRHFVGFDNSGNNTKKYRSIPV